MIGSTESSWGASGEVTEHVLGLAWVVLVSAVPTAVTVVVEFWFCWVVGVGETLPLPVGMSVGLGVAVGGTGVGVAETGIVVGVAVGGTEVGDGVAVGSAKTVIVIV